MQIEGSDPTFKRLYICLGACKEGFKVGCKPIVGLDGSFIKSAQGGKEKIE